MRTATLRFRIDLGTDCSIGPGKIALLGAIRRCGSLSQAARELGMSYRFGWNLLDDLNHSFRAPVSRASVGGRAGGGVELTELGEQLLEIYARAEQRMSKIAAAEFAPLVKGQSPTNSSAPMRRPLPRKVRARVTAR